MSDPNRFISDRDKFYKQIEENHAVKTLLDGYESCEKFLAVTEKVSMDVEKITLPYSSMPKLASRCWK